MSLSGRSSPRATEPKTRTSRAPTAEAISMIARRIDNDAHQRARLLKLDSRYTMLAVPSMIGSFVE